MTDIFGVRKARALLEKSLQNHVPRISPNEAVALQPPMAHNPFEGEFGFAGDLEMMFESELSTNLDCPCEQFGILACPFCDTEQLSKNEIKVRFPMLRSPKKCQMDGIFRFKLLVVPQLT